MCDGQTGYTSKKSDAIIETIVLDLFQQLSEVPKDAIVAQQYAGQIAELQMQLAKARAALQAHTAEVVEYEAEVLKVIRGESKLNHDLLNKLYEEAKERSAESEQVMKRLELRIRDSELMKESLSRQFDNLRTWADVYGECDMERKKMILSRIMKAIRVSRDYEIEIDFTVDFGQLGVDEAFGFDEHMKNTA